MILINIYLQTFLSLQIGRMTMRPEKDLVLLHERSKKTITCMNIDLDKDDSILVCFLKTLIMMI